MSSLRLPVVLRARSYCASALTSPRLFAACSGFICCTAPASSDSTGSPPSTASPCSNFHEPWKSWWTHVPNKYPSVRHKYGDVLPILKDLSVASSFLLVQHRHLVGHEARTQDVLNDIKLHVSQAEEVHHRHLHQALDVQVARFVHRHGSVQNLERPAQAIRVRSGATVHRLLPVLSALERSPKSSDEPSKISSATSQNRNASVAMATRR